MTAERTIPTSEDQAIFQRRLRRLLAACERGGHSQGQTLAIVHRFTLDSVHFSPVHQQSYLRTAQTCAEHGRAP